MDGVELANAIYLAGIVDADGCITYEGVPKGGMSSQIRLLVTNTSTDLVGWLMNNFGGNYHTRHYKNRHIFTHPTTGKKYYGNKDQYEWVLSSGHAIIVLKIILPYLIIKKERALGAIERFYNDMILSKLSATVRKSHLKKATKFYRNLGYDWNDPRTTVGGASNEGVQP